MANRFPYVVSSAGRGYYGPSLQSSQPAFYTIKPQKNGVPDNESNLAVAKFGLGVAALGAAGFIQTKHGNIWDKYVAGMRAVEEYSPGNIFRTFQLSTMASPFESSVRNANLFLHPDLLAKNKTYTNYLSQLIGDKTGSYSRLLQEGATLRKGRLYYGQGSDVALKYATAFRASGYGASSRIGESYARSLGVHGKDMHSFFGSINPAEGIINPELHGRAAQIIGGHSFTQAAGRFMGGLGTEMVERFNRLLDMPIESYPLSDVFGALQKGMQSRFGKKLYFGVAKGGGAAMLGKLALKYGPALSAVTLGYKTLDYTMRNASILNKTAFDEGLTAGLASVVVHSNLAASKFAEVTGLHAYREKQEEMAPGSTSLQKLLAFPLIGATSVATMGYGFRIAKMAHLQATQGLEAGAARQVTEDLMKDWGTFGLKNFGRSLTQKAGFWSRDDVLGKVIKSIASPNRQGELAYRFIGKLTPVKAFSAVAAGIGLAAIAPFIPGALIPSSRPGELEDIYSGRKDVAIRKGRWWTMGRTPYEGQGVVTHIPHWYPRMLMRAREKSSWNEEKGKELSPWQKFWRQEFTNQLEEMHYKDRPYPITSLPFEDVPLIGPVLANTLGRLIKPPQLMHTESWMKGDGSTLVPEGRANERVATEIGQSPQGQPVSPYSAENTFGEQFYRFGEMVGMPGFTFGAIKEKITGTPDFFGQKMQLESSRRIAGAERDYWERELGDLGMTNEAFRRLFPHRRRQIEQYNPIRNEMPDWLPGAGEKSTDFLTGDPYAKIAFGELRLPGRGYEERFPELKGVNPNDYSLSHRFRILADVAPYSDQFRALAGKMKGMRGEKGWSEEDERMYITTTEQLKEKKQGQQFREYQYLSRGSREESTDLQAAINRNLASTDEKPSLFRKYFGGYWEAISHNAETAIDQLTPASPAAKFLHERTSVEAYERQQLYGTKNAFWEHPVRDFIAPFSRLAEKSMGYDATPDHIQKVRNINEYFDILKYVKYQRLSALAKEQHDGGAIKEFETKKKQTLFGLNPFSMNYTNVFNALPRSERDYFNSFAAAETKEERSKILDMVPDNEKALYRARWKIAYAEDIKKASKAGILNDNQQSEAGMELASLAVQAQSEGFPNSKELNAEYQKTRQKGETYGDWYRRVHLLSQMSNIPSADWVGWHPSVDLEDIKLKLVNTIGEDMHEFDLWPSRMADMAEKPYLDDASIAPFMGGQLSESEMHGRIDQLIGSRANAYVNKSPTLQNGSSRIDVEEDRSADMESALRRSF